MGIPYAARCCGYISRCSRARHTNKARAAVLRRGRSREIGIRSALVATAFAMLLSREEMRVVVMFYRACLQGSVCGELSKTSARYRALLRPPTNGVKRWHSRQAVLAASMLKEGVRMNSGCRRRICGNRMKSSITSTLQKSAVRRWREQEMKVTVSEVRAIRYAAKSRRISIVNVICITSARRERR